MALYYITGISGSGKSSVRAELLARGYEAVGTDEDSLAYFYDNFTGERIKNDVPADERTPEWRQRYTWKFPRKEAENLAHQTDDKPMFLCGVTSNDADELWGLFTNVFALIVDDDVLIQRIKDRNNNDFGKTPHEMESLIQWQKTAQTDYEKLGAIIINANQPVSKVVDSILGYVLGSKSSKYAH